jgi:colanic acid/amylovoran biosynthesis protein
MIQIYKKEKLDYKSAKKVGFVLCGFNMLTAPYDKWPRDDSDYIQFAEVIEYIIGEFNASVFLMSHSNGFELPPKFKLITGRDYPIAKQLFEVVAKRGKVNIGNMHLIEGPYNPWETKAIIRQFDMFIAGRLHASVAAFPNLCLLLL